MRLVNRFSCAIAGAVLSLGMAACGGSGDDGGDDIDPNGTNHTYVASYIDLPANGAEAMQLGLDIDEKPNDGVDNQLGMVLGSIGALAPSLDLQASVDEQVDFGDIILLSNVKATDLTNASGVGMWIYLGQNPNPPACQDANDTVCRKHLTGTATFDIDPTGPTDAKLAGRIMSGTFNGGPGTVTLQIALSGGNPINLPLQKAKARIPGITEAGWTGGIIGGAISQDDINTQVIPAIATTVRSSFAEDCTVGGTPPDCGCASGSTGATIKDLFDDNQDCTITDAEVMGVVSGFLTPDIDLDEDGTNDALSLGLGVDAVAGGFTVPAN